MGLGLDVATGGIPFWVLHACFTDDAEIRSTSTVVPLGSTLLATAAIPMGPRNKALAPCPSSVRHGSDLECPLFSPKLTFFLPDSRLTNVPIGVLTSERKADPPGIVLDNVQASNVGILVRSEEGNTLLAGEAPEARFEISGQHISPEHITNELFCSRWNDNCDSLGCWETLQGWNRLISDWARHRGTTETKRASRCTGSTFRQVKTTV